MFHVRSPISVLPAAHHLPPNKTHTRAHKMHTIVNHIVYGFIITFRLISYGQYERSRHQKNQPSILYIDAHARIHTANIANWASSLSLSDWIGRLLFLRTVWNIEFPIRHFFRCSVSVECALFGFRIVFSSALTWALSIFINLHALYCYEPRSYLISLLLFLHLLNGHMVIRENEFYVILKVCSFTRCAYWEWRDAGANIGKQNVHL